MFEKISTIKQLSTLSKTEQVIDNAFKWKLTMKSVSEKRRIHLAK
jgi:hypothetical protein